MGDHRCYQMGPTRCGHSTDEDPCVWQRHHRGEHLLYSEFQEQMRRLDERVLPIIAKWKRERQRAHEAFMGLTSDHLYERCRVLQAQIPRLERHYGEPQPRTLAGKVDPLGTDICKTCLRKWAREQVRT